MSDDRAVRIYAKNDRIFQFLCEAIGVSSEDVERLSEPSARLGRGEPPAGSFIESLKREGFFDGLVVHKPGEDDE